ncbi:YceI family protein [Compostibacter hankyongensis]|uniref:Lipid/polyisoprenoid-binding YceI-like domain-containing protein n=1 Tax=Compostibacter hankyongensis TaxID=1007089 RepID=A0ABP8FPF4_9BACT
MKKLLLAGLLSLGVAGAATGQDVFVCKNAQVSFFSSAPIEDIEARTEQGLSALDTSRKTIYFKVPVKSFRFRKQLMQEHFNEDYLESDRYPYAEFNGRFADAENISAEGSHTVTVEGQLSIHGVNKTYRETGTMTVKNGQITIDAAFKVRLTDHKITIPRLLFNNIAEVVAVKVHALYKKT